jgi:ribosomal protein S18 acetylase RimI-like enzyme
MNSALTDFDPFWNESPHTRGIPVIREVGSADDVATIAQVVDLHFEAFPQGITTQLGRTFVFDYYVAMITSRGASLWVAELDGKVCGFLGCAADRKLFEKSHRSGVVRLQALWRFLTFRLNPFAILRALKKKSLSKKFREPAELLSIVVSPELRRAGVGRRFLKVWSEKMAANKVDSYLVFTDNPEGLSFYEKYGGQCLFKFVLRGAWSACYRFDANTIGSGEFDKKKEQDRPDGDIVDAVLRGEPDSACGSGNG